MKLIGMITFLDSAERENRQTAVMSFGIAADWFKSVKEFMTQEVMTGNYDGTEIMISVFQYDGPASQFDFVPESEFHYDSTNLVESYSIMNPYWV